MSDSKSIDEIRRILEEELQRKEEKNKNAKIVAFIILGVVIVAGLVAVVTDDNMSKGSVLPMTIVMLIIGISLLISFFGANFSGGSDDEWDSDASSTVEEYHPLEKVETEVPVMQENKFGNRVVSQVLSQARFELVKIEKAISKIKSQKFKDPLSILYSIAYAVVQGVANNPETYNEARRLLTYYIPSLTRLAQALEQVEGKRRVPNEKLQQAYETLVKLQPLFDHYLDAVNKPLFNRLDLELNILDVDIKNRSDQQ